MFCCVIGRSIAQEFVEVDLHYSRSRSAAEALEPIFKASSVLAHDVIPRMFEVEICPETGRAFLGLHVDTMDPQLCMVTGVALGSPIDRWNQQCKPDQIVKRWARLVRVDDQPGNTAELIERLKGNFNSLTLTFNNPVELDISVSTGNGHELGLALAACGRTHGLVITGFSDGVVQEWNADHPARPVKVHDRIISVNGFLGDGNSLLALLRKRQRCDLHILSWDC